MRILEISCRPQAKILAVTAYRYTSRARVPVLGKGFGPSEFLSAESVLHGQAANLPAPISRP
jgi:hypothetical protein